MAQVVLAYWSAKDLLDLGLRRRVESSAMPTNAAGKQWLADKEKEAGVVKLPSGLLYKVIESGSGTTKPLAGTPIDANYTGFLIDGTKFDSSFDRGRPLSCKPNGVVAG